MDRRTFLRGSAVAAAGALAFEPLRHMLEGASAAVAPPGAVPYRAFSADSEWNNPLPADAPIDPSSDAFIAELKSFDRGVGHPRLAAGDWAEPIFWVRGTDREFSLAHAPVPVRIPADAAPAGTSDSQMTIYDLERGYVTKLHRARFDGTRWTAQTGSFYVLDSNGLIGTLPESDEPRNRGHRGYPPPLHAVRWDEVQYGEIAHVLKVAIHDTAPRHVYPGGGDEDGSGIIPEGAIMRIKPSVDLGAKRLTPAALVIATAMQRYGVVIGDRSGVPMALKLENLPAEGRSERWSDVDLRNDSLSSITFDDFEFIRLGYHRPVTNA